MFLPLHDDAPMRRLRAPNITYGLIGLNVVMFLLTLGEPMVAALRYGTIPAVLFGEASLPSAHAVIPASATLVTTQFVHGSIWHLASNMLFLWVFGDNVEDAMGHVRFLAFYLLCGIVASLVHAILQPTSRQPLIGASGAISGVVAAYVMLYPRVHVFGLFLKGIPLAVRAMWAIGFWMVAQLAQALLGGDAGVAWFAHLGGILAGVLLVRPFIARDVKLFGG